MDAGDLSDVSLNIARISDDTADNDDASGGFDRPPSGSFNIGSFLGPPPALLAPNLGDGTGTARGSAAIAFHTSHNAAATTTFADCNSSHAANKSVTLTHTHPDRWKSGAVAKKSHTPHS